MKRKYFKSSGEPYWEWEKTHKVYVYVSKGVAQRYIESVIRTITDVVREFNLPLTALNGSSKSENTPHIEKLIAGSLRESCFDFDRVEEELEKMRKKEVLPYGIVILIDYNKYEFNNPPNSDEPAIYGCASPEGLIVLRRFDLQNAVRHEFGHMIGLGRHHKNCVMDWSCSQGEFCEDCKREIKELWEI